MKLKLCIFCIILLLICDLVELIHTGVLEASGFLFGVTITLGYALGGGFKNGKD